MGERVPRIGITTYGRNEANWFRLPSEYVDAVRRAGGLPLLLPPGEPRPDQWLELLDGVVLAGGGDLAPATYGGEVHSRCYDVGAERDETELKLLPNQDDLIGLFAALSVSTDTDKPTLHRMFMTALQSARAVPNYIKDFLKSLTKSGKQGQQGLAAK